MSGFWEVPTLTKIIKPFRGGRGKLEALTAGPPFRFSAADVNMKRTEGMMMNVPSSLKITLYPCRTMLIDGLEVTRAQSS